MHEGIIVGLLLGVIGIGVLLALLGPSLYKSYSRVDRIPYHDHRKWLSRVQTNTLLPQHLTHTTQGTRVVDFGAAPSQQPDIPCSTTPPQAMEQVPIDAQLLSPVSNIISPISQRPSPRSRQHTQYSNLLSPLSQNPPSAAETPVTGTALTFNFTRPDGDSKRLSQVTIGQPIQQPEAAVAQSRHASVRSWASGKWPFRSSSESRNS